MGKRSDFKHIARDAYDTPPEAVRPLLVHLSPPFTFAEPCAGAGMLLDALVAAGGKCVLASDIEPRRQDIEQRDAMTLTAADVAGAIIVTNPPYQRDVLHPLIARFVSIASTCWLLLPAGFKENVGTADLVAHLRSYQPAGRIRWIAGTKMSGMEDHGWYGFGRERGESYRGFPRVRQQGRLPLDL